MSNHTRPIKPVRLKFPDLPSILADLFADGCVIAKNCDPWPAMEAGVYSLMGDYIGQAFDGKMLDAHLADIEKPRQCAAAAKNPSRWDEKQEGITALNEMLDKQVRRKGRAGK